MSFYKCKIFCFIWVIVIFVPNLTKAETVAQITIPYIHPEDHRHDYVVDLLRLSLNKTIDEYGDYELKQYQLPTEQDRSLRMVKCEGGIDIVWSMTSIKREKEFLPIRIPLQKGLLGYRVFIIKAGRQDSFRKIKLINNLKYFIAGQGHDWPDTKILRANGLPVETCSHYSFCFDMLLQNRFDYLPRSVSEPWNEIAKYPNKELVVEKKLLLKYTAPLYFFVSRKNVKMAERLEKGLRLAIKDGSFDKLFYNHPQLRTMFEKICFNKRIVIELKNPLLPPETPTEDKSLWIDLKKLP
ncbi:hypothetical protein [Maridesulfovibrio sp.]|uniref:hypothetical protein n=1 Tax=Maridesulfovibrio sp. TaxID=2795000 RepID=UPI002A18D3A7|nr:hypothetical protein [Maridesulfovibrio sp.]